MKCLAAAIMTIGIFLGDASRAADAIAGISAYYREDYATALFELQPLADQDHAIAQYLLGKMYARGRGVPQDYTEAVRWFRKAAEQGEADAQIELGLIYGKGRGVSLDYTEAGRWFRKAAAQGEAKAHYNLGNMYAMGLGFPQDYVSAHMWYNIASANGDAKAQKRRDEIQKEMPFSDVSKAQRRARICMSSKYQDCD